jgi:hypothetical protein
LNRLSQKSVLSKMLLPFFGGGDRAPIKQMTTNYSRPHATMKQLDTRSQSILRRLATTPKTKVEKARTVENEETVLFKKLERVDIG